MLAGVPLDGRTATGLDVRRSQLMLAILWTLFLSPAALADNTVSTIERVKGSVVAVGTFERTRVPAFQFRATGFAVGDGSLIATNAHVLPAVLDSERRETLAVVVPAPGREPQVREAREVAVDAGTDLAVLKINGQPLPALKLGGLDSVREGQSVLFTGFPIGAVLGIFAATHRGMVAAITPIAIPPALAANLNPSVFRRLTTGSFPVLQLDATAYPGNSGSPVYDPESGEVLG
ncbi:MAG TPA: serine protease, partial [Casimicrobiaceae bacterium]|nr:serine protease [Casimicrobiaceae bacterium]